MKISIITPSIRPKGLDITQKCLSEQVFKDFEWLVDIGIPGKGHDLNAAFNRMIKRARGELLVFYQDYIKVNSDYLEKFWRAYQEHPNTFFTSPVGKVQNQDFSGEIKWDWRAWKQNENQIDYTDCLPRCWEIDSGAAPKDAIYKIGGFDEEFDKHWSADNLSVGVRADLAGYKFKCVFSNPAIAWDHDAHIKHPFRDKYNTEFINDRINAYKAGFTVDFLTDTV